MKKAIHLSILALMFCLGNKAVAQKFFPEVHGILAAIYGKGQKDLAGVKTEVGFSGGIGTTVMSIPYKSSSKNSLCLNVEGNFNYRAFSIDGMLVKTKYQFKDITAKVKPLGQPFDTDETDFSKMLAFVLSGIYFEYGYTFGTSTSTLYSTSSNPPSATSSRNFPHWGWGFDLTVQKGRTVTSMGLGPRYYEWTNSAGKNNRIKMKHIELTFGYKL